MDEDLSTREASVREVWKMALPIIFSQASLSLLGLVDTWFMGRISPEAQAAVGFGAPTVFSLLSLFFGLFAGLTTFVSQYYGAKKFSDCGKMLWQMLFLAVGIGLICAMSMNPLVTFLLNVMGTNPDIYDFTVDYMQIRMWSAPVMFLSFTLLSFLRGIGDMKTPAIVAAVAVLLNVPLTYIFAFGLGPIPAFGASGAAIGTVLSQCVETGIYAGVVWSKKNHALFQTRKFVRAELESYRQIAKVALPVGLSWAIENWGWVVYGLYITTLPKEQSAANAIIQNFMNLAWMPGLAISIAATTLVGQYMGAKNIRSAEKSAHYAIVLAIVCLFSLGVIMFLLRYPIASGFSNDPAVIEIAANLFYFAFVYQIFDATGTTTSGALRGAGDTKFPVLIGFVGIWGVMVPLVFILDYFFDWGIYGAWAAGSFSIILCGCLYFARFKSGKWKSMYVA